MTTFSISIEAETPAHLAYLVDHVLRGPSDDGRSEAQLLTAVSIVAELARSVPILSGVGDAERCVICHATGPDLARPDAHPDDCAWVAARRFADQWP